MARCVGCGQVLCAACCTRVQGRNHCAACLVAHLGSTSRQLGADRGAGAIAAVFGLVGLGFALLVGVFALVLTAIDALR